MGLGEWGGVAGCEVGILLFAKPLQAIASQGEYENEKFPAGHTNNACNKTL